MGIFFIDLNKELFVLLKKKIFIGNIQFINNTINTINAIKIIRLATVIIDLNIIFVFLGKYFRLIDLTPPSSSIMS